MIDIPFHPNYFRNQERAGDNLPCLVCGKVVTRANPKQARMWWGTVLVTEAEAVNLDSAGDMGYYPIGSECLRKHPELNPYVAKKGLNDE